MSTTAQFDAAAGQLKLSGELTFDTVLKTLKETESLFKTKQPLEVDLSNVTKSDSAGLALLIHWLRTAQQTQKTVSFAAIPTQLLAMAEASGLQEILPLQAANS